MKNNGSRLKKSEYNIISNNLEVTTMDTKNNDITLLKVSYNEDTNNYSVTLRAGSSVPETAFCMAVICKCLVRDKVIDNVSVVTDLIKKYIEDPQYNELEDTKDDDKK